MPTKQVVIDACSAINLMATERAIEFLRTLDWTLLVLPEVKQEAQRLRGPLDEEGQPTWLPTDWNPLEQAGLVTPQPSALLGDAFVEALVDAAAHLTDVDAAAVALAGTLGLPLLSDDGKVRKVFRMLYPALELHATLGLIRQVSNHLGLDPATVRSLLQALRWKARFAPPKTDPDREWYLSHLAD
jgi:predicted nucleic acid-binding protein